MKKGTGSTVKPLEIADMAAYLPKVKQGVLMARTQRERFCWLVIQAVIEGKINQSKEKGHEHQ